MENKQYLPVRFELSAIGKLVLRGTRIVVPESLRGQILKVAHEGYPGIVNMKKILRGKVWWPGIDKQVEQFCKTCYRCQLVSQTTKPEPMIRTELPAGPWQHLAADLLVECTCRESSVLICIIVSFNYPHLHMSITLICRIISHMSLFLSSADITCLVITFWHSNVLTCHFKLSK